MKRIITMKRVSIVGVTSVALLIGAVLGTSFNCNASGAEGFSPYVDAMGHISLPKDFQTRFVHLGSWAVVDDRSSKGLHNVYTERKTVEQYRKTGKFPRRSDAGKRDSQAGVGRTCHWPSGSMGRKSGALVCYGPGS